MFHIGANDNNNPANAALIVAACNACHSLNSADPLCVAENLVSIISEARSLMARLAAMDQRQHELLVQGQTLASASQNWDAHPEAFAESFLDFGPLVAALARIEAAT